MSSPLSPHELASSPSPKRSPSLVLWQRICSACSIVIPGHVQVEDVGVQPGPAMSRPPASTGGMMGCLSIADQTAARVGPLQMTFAFVPPDRYEKSLLLGLTLLPPGLFQTAVSAGVAGE